jgi:hypothetical protein
MKSLYEISNDNGVRVVNFATSENLIVKSATSAGHNIYKFTWTSPDEKIHYQVDDILINRTRHSRIVDVRSFRATDCNIDLHLVVANIGRDWQ